MVADSVLGGLVFSIADKTEDFWDSQGLQIRGL